MEPLERCPLFGQGDGRALDIGAQVVADEGEVGHFVLR
jgi:hypothetical protein